MADAIRRLNQEEVTLNNKFGQGHGGGRQVDGQGAKPSSDISEPK